MIASIDEDNLNGTVCYQQILAALPMFLGRLGKNGGKQSLFSSAITTMKALLAKMPNAGK